MMLNKIDTVFILYYDIIFINIIPHHIISCHLLLPFPVTPHIISYRIIPSHIIISHHITDTPSPVDTTQSQSLSEHPSAPKVVIVGSGPSGLFAALTLAAAGLKPIILERGAVQCNLNVCCTILSCICNQIDLSISDITTLLPIHIYPRLSCKK